jgi:hypothetical protein
LVLVLLIVIAVLLAILVLANDTARALLVLFGRAIVVLAVLAALAVGVLMFASYALSSPDAFADAAFGVGALVIVGGGAIFLGFTEMKLKETDAGQRAIGRINAVLGAILIAVVLGFGVSLFVSIATAAIQGRTDASWLGVLVAAAIPGLLGWMCFGIAKQVGLIRTARRPEAER